jgi:hypothetical protein
LEQHRITQRRNVVDQTQKDLFAIVFDMKESQLRSALFQLIKGDDLKTAIDKARAKKTIRDQEKIGEIFG